MAVSNRVKYKGILKPIHYKAARLLLAGWTPAMVGKEIGVKSTVVESWKFRTPFQKLLIELEDQYHAVLDKEILDLRRNAFHELREGLHHPDLFHRRWAVNTILTSTVTAEMRDSVSINVQGGSELNAKAKELAKQFLIEATPSYSGMGVVKNAEA